MGPVARRRRRLERHIGVRTATLGANRKLICDLSISYDRSVYLGKEELRELRLLSELLRPGDVFVDCGANIGLFTVWGADLVGSRGTVIACEPVAETFRRLEENCALNDIADRVRLVNRAVAAEGGLEVRLAGDAHNVMSIDASSDIVGQVATTITIDHLVDGSSEVAGLKVDVEGYELATLRGGEETIARSTPWILIEFNSELVGISDLQSWRVHAFLTARGYRAYLPRTILAGDRAALPDSWRNTQPHINLFYCCGEIPATRA
jgi:FkbM family methyltransferase